MDNEHPVIAKIRKLQVLADRATNEAEASLAAERVQELLTKHNLEIGQIALSEEPGSASDTKLSWVSLPHHAAVIAHACSELLDVKHYYRGRSVASFRRRRKSVQRWCVFIGLNANVEAATLTYHYLLESIDALARGAKDAGLIHGSSDFLGFRMGAAERIRAMVRDRKAKAVACDPAGYGQLVHVANSVSKKMYDAIKFGPARSASQPLWSVLSSAYEHGFEQGGRIDITAAQSNRMLK